MLALARDILNFIEFCLEVYCSSTLEFEVTSSYTQVGNKLKKILPFWEFLLSLHQKDIVRVIAKRTLREYWEKNPETEQQLSAWYREASKAYWETPNEIKEQYKSASILKNSRVVFNICGNKYRLVVEINFPRKWVFIRFVGTHREYDQTDVNNI